MPQSLLKTYADCDTYWDKIRQQKQITYTDIAEYLGTTDKMVYGWFCGKRIPSRFQVKWLCTYFNVDFNVGVSEFVNAHKEYQRVHPNNLPKNSNTNTYWSRLRIERGLSYDVITHYTGSNNTMLATWFRGDNVPKDEMILKLCELFSVDFNEGKQHFWEDFQTRHPGKNPVHWNPKHNRPAPPPNKSLRIYKDTFWNRLRLQKGISTKQLVKMLGIKSGSFIYAWFSGQHVPPDKYIRKFCEIYEIDYEKGKQEFFDAHAGWYSWNLENKKACIATERQGMYTPKKDNRDSEIAEIPTSTLQDMQNLRKKILWDRIPPEMQKFICEKIAECKQQIINELHSEIDFYTFDAIVNYLKLELQTETYIPEEGSNDEGLESIQ